MKTNSFLCDRLTKKRVLQGLGRWTGTVTDLRKNSRNPSLARAVLFPVLLLIVCKKKQTTNYFTLCLSQHLLEFFLHSIWSSSKSRSHPPGVWGQKADCHATFSRETTFLQRRGGTKRSQVTKILSLDLSRMLHKCKVGLAFPQLAKKVTEGSEVLTWEHN